MPTQILVECPDYIVSASLGVVECLKPFEKTGGCEIRFIKTVSIKAKDIVWADILVTVRGCETQSVRIVEEAKTAGRLIVYYLDDDLLNIPEESLAREYYDDFQIEDGMRRILAMTDVLWGVNPNIKEIYLPLTGGRWIRNRVPKVPSAPLADFSGGQPVKILYAGSTDHAVIVREILSPVVKRICKEYGDRVSATFIGVNPYLSELSNVRYIPFIKPYEAYQDFVNKGNFAIGLAPGRTTRFFGCKYYNKFLEYSAIGAVGVYTRYEPFTQIVEDRVNGMLCENTEEGWYQAIKALLDDPALLRRCAQSARDLLIAQFDPEAAAEDLLSQCPEFCGFKAPACDEKSIRLGSAFFTFYWERTKLLWRNKGVLGLPIIAWRVVKVLTITVWRGIRRLVQNLFQRDHR